MAKTIDSNFQTHLEQTTTTLAMCWHITRKDGKEFFFTNHDQDLEIDGDIYTASYGFDQTAIQSSIDLSVDNLELIGILDATKVSVNDLRLGLYDNAEVELFIVNWSDLTQGKIKTRKGWLGNVQIGTNGAFTAELRGILQQLVNPVIETTSPTCRADLGDTRCGIPILPSVLGREQAVLRKEVYRVPTNPSYGRVFNLNVINRDFETGDLTGWTTEVGSPLVTNSVTIDAYQGSYYLWCTTGTYDFEVSQTVDITDWSYEVDNDDIRAYFTCRAAINTTDPDDTWRIRLQALDGSDVYISDIYDSGFENGTNTEDRWHLRGGYYLTVPNGTRKLKIILTGLAVSDDRSNASFDDVQLSLLDKTFNREDYDKLAYNIDFENGDSTNWNVNVGTFSIDNADSGTTPNTGQWFFQSKGEVTTDIHYDIDLTTTEIPTADIDDELYDVTLDYYVTVNVAGEPDELDVTFIALDGSDNIIIQGGKPYLYTQKWTGTTLAEDIWQQRTKTVTLPANTRKLRVKAVFTRQNGTNNNVCLDDIDVTLERNVKTYGSEIYENRYYQVTKAGTTDYYEVLYNTSVGSTTTDGTAQLRAYNAWTRHGEVATVTNNRQFTVTIDESRAVDDWFNYGLLTWETGNNAGYSIEVKDWVQSTNTVTIYLPAIYDVQVGDKFRMYAGCNKSDAHCIGKFNNFINFRGEPFMAGPDVLYSYPDPK